MNERAPYDDSSELFSEKEQNRLQFVKWLVDNGMLVVGIPDGTAVLKRRVIGQPAPHVEWRLRIIDDDPLPPAA